MRCVWLPTDMQRVGQTHRKLMNLREEIEQEIRSAAHCVFGLNVRLL